jgi:hypothetical protein
MNLDRRDDYADAGTPVKGESGEYPEGCCALIRRKKRRKKMKYFNTTLGISMLPDGEFSVSSLSNEEATEYLRGEVENIANPQHANSLQALTQKVGVDVLDTKGGRISLQSGDECLVAEISGIPRETREFTDAEIAAATFRFRLVVVK